MGSNNISNKFKLTDSNKLENKIKKYTFLIRGVNKIKRKIYGIS